MIKLLLKLDGVERVLLADDLIEASARLGFVPTNSLRILEKQLKTKFADSSISEIKRVSDSLTGNIVV